jgi:hypothetical protein
MGQGIPDLTQLRRFADQILSDSASKPVEGMVVGDAYGLHPG